MAEGIAANVKEINKRLPESKVLLTTESKGATPRLHDIEVMSRIGLDLSPIDPADQEARRAADAFFADTLGRGHEGVVLKGLDTPYSAGRRGSAWLKVKPVHTLDLVVLAAEWGHGRRTGKLSNLHLGARRDDGTYAMLGKTFKGMTDVMLAWQTERLSELAVEDDGFTVRVRPELVVEIAYDGLQRSTRYPAGVTLRFARVVRYREDKSVGDADTVETVLGRYEG